MVELFQMKWKFTVSLLRKQVLYIQNKIIKIKLKLPIGMDIHNGHPNLIKQINKLEYEIVFLINNSIYFVQVR